MNVSINTLKGKLTSRSINWFYFVIVLNNLPDKLNNALIIMFLFNWQNSEKRLKQYFSTFIPADQHSVPYQHLVMCCN